MTNKAFLAHQRSFLDSQIARIVPLEYRIEKLEITVNPGVFPPATDTKLLLTHVHPKSGSRIADLTTGSGIIAVKAGLAGASGIAVDINPSAVVNAQETFLKYKVPIDVLQSNLFENISPQKFDTIYVNGPFNEGEVHHPLEHSSFGAGKFITNLFDHLTEYLDPKGELLIVLAAWSDHDYFIKKANSKGFKAEVIDFRESDDKQRRYLLYRVCFD